AGVLIGVATGALVTAARVHLREAAPLAALARAHASVHVRLTVTDDPRPVRGAAGRPSAYLIPASATTIDSEKGRIQLSVQVLVLATDPAWRGLLPGTPAGAAGRLSPARGGDLAGATLSVAGPP